ncbi:MAG: hypothetical protein ACJ746_09395 [Bryobacteraceae bacterium]
MEWKSLLLAAGCLGVASRPLPPWVPGHWRNSPAGYYWVDGHWR